VKSVWLVLLPVALMAQPAGPAAPAASVAPADPLDALAADSPFLPGSGARSPAATSTGPLELRSIVFVDGAYRFSVFDQGTSEANWVGIGERGYPFVARSFDRERDSLTVEHQGRTVVLALQPARMASSGHMQPPSPSPLPGQGDPTNPTNRRNAQGGPVANPAGGNPPGGPNATQPNPAEAQRLQNLADEIRRRRAMGSRINLPQPQPQPQKKN
jgi:hypothetical protein